MNFTKLMDTLARSSAQAVSTLGHGSPEADQLKDYLYIETSIEHDFKVALDNISDQRAIIFLCGSSGDGKSEILKRHYQKYSDHITFHLDATHSFKPDQNAIEALDQVFDRYKEAGKPLVVGINVGMLFNYASTGSERHVEIKQSIERFTQSESPIDGHIFLNFEDYPKFSLQNGEAGSAFISELLDKIAAPIEANPLYLSYQNACRNHQSRVFDNYRLLQIKEVRERIVTLLLFARLRYDQFLSARTLLDFVHHLICGPGSLFDNLFIRGQNELADIVSHFDPCSVRTQKIDQFLVQQSLGVSGTEFGEFKSQFLNDFCFGDLEPSEWLRAFYVLSGHPIGNNYHQRFASDFKESLYERYIEVWRLHQHYDHSSEKKQLVRHFYKDQIVSALMRFGNRLQPSLTSRRQIYLSERNGVVISAEADVRPDLKRIQEAQTKSIHHFYVCLKVGDEQVRPLPINVSFLELILKINDGYRPNKHDKNTIVILEEMIDEITKVARQAKTIHFTSGTNHVSLTNEVDDDEFVVGGME
ncbi:DNA phosphorothioation-dependent restriction protein DptF [Nitrincola sp.]|uniref:DNA phosphorothioation-dependent restriction protein DptF n=1 Tax=Nitrincola sp. TaxID=1926584 RepID=UPI003A8D2CDC